LVSVGSTNPAATLIASKGIAKVLNIDPLDYNSEGNKKKKELTKFDI